MSEHRYMSAYMGFRWSVLGLAITLLLAALIAFAISAKTRKTGRKKNASDLSVQLPALVLISLTDRTI